MKGHSNFFANLSIKAIETLMKLKVTPRECIFIACVANVSNRVIARKLERKQKKVEGGGEKRKRLPANPTILENAP